MTAPYADRERFLEAFRLIERRIEDRWEIPVVISDVPAPFTGDLDGAEIRVDHDLDPEDALFIVVHLFGHTVQWNVSEEARAIAKHPGPWDDANLAALRAYEREACQYSLTLFHDAGVHDLDQWLADFSACDYAYLEHVFTTGAKPPFRTFWRADQPALAPLPIPPFTPTRWWNRWDGVVV
ncbi:MAG: hypothetical protein IPL61_03675 [Myxococcales bacterium]|nr:hypothetical protein [Myxococcales bacterium]